MPITYNATAGTGTYTSAGATVTTIPLTLPGTPTDGDLLILATGTILGTGATITLPAKVVPFQTQVSSSTSSTLSAAAGLYYRRWRTGDPLTYTITSSVAKVCSGVILALSGVKDPQMLDGPAVTGAFTATTGHGPNNQGCLTAGAWLIGALAVNAAGGTVTPPGGMTERSEVSSGNIICHLGTEQIAVPSNNLARFWTFSNGQVSSQVVALRPAEAAAPTYYVRPDGNDGNLGTGPGPGEAYATLARALGGLSALNPGEKVWVAPGTYRETVVLGFPNCPPGVSDHYEVQGDVEAAAFPDIPVGGPVTWTAYTAGDATTPATAACLQGAGRNNVTLSDLLFVGGNPVSNGTCVYGGLLGASPWTQEQWGLERCHFTQGKQAAVGQVELWSAPLGTPSSHWVNRCTFDIPATAYGLLLNQAAATTGTGDQPSNISVRNALFMGGVAGIQAAVNGSGNYRTGQVEVLNCTFRGCTTGIVLASAAGSFSYPWVVANCLFSECSVGANGGFNGSVADEFNLVGCPTARSNVLGGGTDVVGIAYARLVATGQEGFTGQRVRPVGMPLPGSPVTNWGRSAMQARSPTAVANDAAIGTVAWSSPASAIQADDARATAVAVPAVSGQSNYLVATGFGFSVPGDATVLGFRVVFEGSAGATSAIRVNAVRLVKGGVIGGEDKSPENQASFSTSDSAVTFGAVNNLWSQTWTPAEVNASNFGVAISMKNIHASTVTDARIDAINLVVAYVRPSNPVPDDLLGAPRPPTGSAVLPAAGCLECGNTMVKDVDIAHTAAPSGRIDGPGYQDFQIALPDSAITVSAWLRKNATYTGPEPTITLLKDGELGTTAHVTAALTVGADTWEKLSVTQTPTRTGIGILRIVSSSTSTTGSVWVDDVAVA